MYDGSSDALFSSCRNSFAAFEFKFRILLSNLLVCVKKKSLESDKLNSIQ